MATSRVSFCTTSHTDWANLQPNWAEFSKERGTKELLRLKTACVSLTIKTGKSSSRNNGKMVFITARLSASMTKEKRYARSTTMLTSAKATTRSTITNYKTATSMSMLPTRANSCTRSLMVRAA